MLKGFRSSDINDLDNAVKWLEYIRTRVEVPDFSREQMSINIQLQEDEDELEVPSSSSLYTDDDQNNLKYLLEAFGSVVSLEDIASAYCQASRDIDITTDILCSKQESAIGSSTSKTLESTESAYSVY